MDLNVQLQRDSTLKSIRKVMGMLSAIMVDPQHHHELPRLGSVNTDEQLHVALDGMTDNELAERVSRLTGELCRTSGQCWSLTIPPRPDDADMLLTELVKRFTKTCHALQVMQEQNARLLNAETTHG